MWLSDSEQAKDGTTVSTLQEIGELLRQARLEQGLSCEQLAQSLKMGSEQLQALENGDLQRLPLWWGMGKVEDKVNLSPA